MHSEDKTHIKTGIKHEKWVWTWYTLICKILNQTLVHLQMVQTSVSVMGKGK